MEGVEQPEQPLAASGHIGCWSLLAAAVVITKE
jgi:hypothetical protein